MPATQKEIDAMNCSTRPVWALSALALLATLAAAAWAQKSSHTPDAQGEACRLVLADLEVLGSDLIGLDRQLVIALESMRRATGEGRLDATQDALETMAGQRRVMFQKLKLTHQELALHLVAHMSAESFEQARQGLDACPVIAHLKVEQRAGTASPSTGTPLDR
jgi:hypothetical protein